MEVTHRDGVGITDRWSEHGTDGPLPDATEQSKLPAWPHSIPAQTIPRTWEAWRATSMSGSARLRSIPSGWNHQLGLARQHASGREAAATG